MESDCRENLENSIFISEKDVFTIKICFYFYKEALIVEGVSDNFNESFAKDNSCNIESFDVTLKYPSCGDQSLIIRNVESLDSEKISVYDIKLLELSRLSVLIRDWTLKRDFTEIYNLDVNIVDAILLKIRDVIALKGIF